MTELDTEERELQEALALSMREQFSCSPASKKSPREIISLISDEEDGDDDLDKPVLRRQQSIGKGPPPKQNPVGSVQSRPRESANDRSNDRVIIQESGDKTSIFPIAQNAECDPVHPLEMPPPVTPNPVPHGQGFLGGLSRKQMEEERLARANKRKAENSPKSRSHLHSNGSDAELLNGDRVHDDRPAVKRAMIRPNLRKQVSKPKKEACRSLMSKESTNARHLQQAELPLNPRKSCPEGDDRSTVCTPRYGSLSRP
jgi:hypothetical protein